MPLHFYEEDFTTPASLEKFRSLLAKAEWSFSLPLHEGNSEEGLRQPDQRNLQYEDVGRFIARECQILVALWDGTKTNLPGGTGEVVELQLRGVPREDRDAIDPPEGSPVYQIVTPRVKNPHPEGAFSIHRIYPPASKDDAAAAETYYTEMYSRLDTFNRAIKEPDQRLDRGVKQSKEYLFPKGSDAALPSRQAMLLTRYAFADALAIIFQQKVKLMARLLHWSVFLAFVSFLLFAHPPSIRHPDPRIWFIPSIIFLALGLWFNRAARDAGFDTKYQDYRAIAEGMRVKLFWELSGIRGRVTDYYLTKQRTELDWIRNGLRGWYLELHGSTTADSQKAEHEFGPQGLKLALVHWVDDQRKYFKSAAERHSHSDEGLRRWAHQSGAAALVIAILLMLISSHFAVDRESLWPFILPIEMALAGSALILHYNEQMAHAEHAKQYRRMFATFDYAFTLAESEFKAGDYCEARRYLSSLGKEALAENGDWVLLHRAHPLELTPP